MKYNDEELKKLILEALEQTGYYDELCGIDGGKEAREDKGYYNGRSEALLEVQGIKDFDKTDDAVNAYNNGIKALRNNLCND